jgi:hypothetical protein
MFGSSIDQPCSDPLTNADNFGLLLFARAANKMPLNSLDAV